ncbi:MAG: hypothetical protein DRZ82_07455 [Thermoprotei archaeon]|nr:MAG: hypothetical protein DRZ82_07455 [Thermoprotei archaeon]
MAVSHDSKWLLLVICSSIVGFSGALLNLAYTFYIVEETTSGLLISLGIVLPMFFNSFSKIWGFLADYYNSRKLFILIGWFSSSLTLILPLLKLNLTNILMASIFGTALWSIGSPALAAEIMRYDEPGSRLGIWRSIGDAFYLAGTLSAGILYEELGIRVILALSLVIYLIVGILIALLYKPMFISSREKSTGLLRDFIEDLKVSFLSREGLLLSLIVVILWFSIWSIEGLARAKMLEILASEMSYSFITTLAVAIEMILAPFIGRFIDHYGPLLGTLFGILLHLITGTTLALSNNPIMLSIAWVIPFSYMLSCSFYIIYGRLTERLADAVGTYNTLVSIIALPASIAASIADYIGRDLAILLLTLISSPSIALLIPTKKLLSQGKRQV